MRSFWGLFFLASFQLAYGKGAVILTGGGYTRKPPESSHQAEPNVQHALDDFFRGLPRSGPDKAPVETLLILNATTPTKGTVYTRFKWQSYQDAAKGHDVKLVPVYLGFPGDIEALLEEPAITTEQQLIERINNAKGILIAGGMPNLIDRFVSLPRVRDAIGKAVQDGASFYGNSAGANVAGTWNAHSIWYAAGAGGEDIVMPSHWSPGLGVAHGIYSSHLDDENIDRFMKAKKGRIESMLRLAPYPSIALPIGTYVIIRDGRIHARGGEITLSGSDGKTWKMNPGESCSVNFDKMARRP